MNVRGLVGAVALSTVGVVGAVAAPAAAGAVTTINVTLDCTGRYPVHVMHELQPLQLRILNAAVAYVNSHPALGTQCTVTINP
jgi:hypothetical protein